MSQKFCTSPNGTPSMDQPKCPNTPLACAFGPSQHSKLQLKAAALAVSSTPTLFCTYSGHHLLLCQSDRPDLNTLAEVDALAC